MPSGQVSVWVPLAVAFVGLLGVLATQILMTRREERRWSQEQDRADSRRRIEKSQEFATRQVERKIDIYAAFWMEFEKLGSKIHPIARNVLDGGVLTHDDEEKLATLRELPQEALGAVNLQASEEWRDLIGQAVNSRADFMRMLAQRDHNRESLAAKWDESWDSWRRMRRAILNDIDDSVIKNMPDR